jgi:hypothetical protein
MTNFIHRLMDTSNGVNRSKKRSTIEQFDGLMGVLPG